MNVWQRLREAVNPAAPAVAELREQVKQETWTNELLVERLAELELALEDQGWTRLSGDGDNDFSREALRKITRMARIYWLKNPLIKRAVTVKQTYVFGQGVNISAKAPAVNDVIQAFATDHGNAKALTSHEAMTALEAELETSGNLFFTLFTNVTTGAVSVRTIPFDEIDDVIANPDDATEPWFYVRKRMVKTVNLATGTATPQLEVSYLPDWRYKPTGARPTTINGARVRWDAPVYHVAVNKLPSMRFGVSELYAAIDWARSHKEFLENWATIVKSYARFAWNVTTTGGAAGKARAKTALGTTMGDGDSFERNPQGVAGSAIIGNQNQKIEPIKTAGATTAAEDGRQLLLMVCAATDIPEHYFGDPSTGNMATSTTMERPMELMILSRRKLWSDVLGAILCFVIDANVRAIGGVLDGEPTRDAYGRELVILAPDPEGKSAEPMSRHVDVDFPALLDHDVQQRITAIVTGATLDGKALAGTMDLPMVARLVLMELGVDDIDSEIARLFPEGWEEERAAQAAEKMAAAQDALVSQADQTVKEAAAVLREALITVHSQLQEMGIHGAA